MAHAILNGHDGAALALALKGADPTLPDKQGRTALNLAKEEGYTSLVSYLEAQAQAHGHKISQEPK